jgi:hypothetical protein
MNKNYEARVHQVLTDLYLVGVVVVPWPEAYLWFETQRFAKMPFRRLLKEWEELCETNQRVWPERTKVPKLYQVKHSASNAFVIQRAHFSDEESVDFAELAE